MAEQVDTTTLRRDELLERNRATVLRALSGSSTHQDGGMTLALERFVVDRASGGAVPFFGSFGLEQVLALIAQSNPGSAFVHEGHLVGLRGLCELEDGGSVRMRVSVGAGAQLCVSVGPVETTHAALAALEAFQRQFHLACRTLGRDYELIARGCHPTVSDPSEIVLVPQQRHVLLNAHLARTGRLSRHAMRLTAGTRLVLPMSPEGEAIRVYQLLVALSPVIAFLTDNSLSLQAPTPEQTPRMARALVWDQVDPSRCGMVPGTFSDDFSLTSYGRWVEGVCPVYLTTDDGITYSCGSDTCGDLMAQRELSATEVRRMLATTFPIVRMTGSLELRAADALPPRMAGAYLALLRGLLATPETRQAAARTLRLDQIDEAAWHDAWAEFRAFGWQARAYGRTAAQLAHELADIAERGLPDRREREALAPLTQLWDVHSVPRDMLLRPAPAPDDPASDLRAAELYGDGAVIPFDELQGDPPAGSTAVMRFS